MLENSFAKYPTASEKYISEVQISHRCKAAAQAHIAGHNL